MRRATWLIIGSLLLPLGCDPTGPAYATLVVATTSLRDGFQSVAYSETLTATGGDGSYTWSVTVGSLPTGLSLTTSSGLISGTPTGSGSTFTVEVASGDGQTDTQQLTITVNVFSDTISLVSITPPANTVLGRGKEVTFTATIDYTLATAASGQIVMVIQDLANRNLKPGVPQASVRISRGSGRLTISDSIIVPEEGVTTVVVDLPLFPGQATQTEVVVGVSYPVE